MYQNHRPELNIQSEEQPTACDPESSLYEVQYPEYEWNSFSNTINYLY